MESDECSERVINPISDRTTYLMRSDCVARATRVCSIDTESRPGRRLPEHIIRQTASDPEKERIARMGNIDSSKLPTG